MVMIEIFMREGSW